MLAKQGWTRYLTSAHEYPLHTHTHTHRCSNRATPSVQLHEHCFCMDCSDVRCSSLTYFTVGPVSLLHCVIFGVLWAAPCTSTNSVASYYYNKRVCLAILAIIFHYPRSSIQMSQLHRHDTCEAPPAVVFGFSAYLTTNHPL